MKDKWTQGAWPRTSLSFTGFFSVSLLLIFLANPSVSAAPQSASIKKGPIAIAAVKAEQKEYGLSTLRQAIKDDKVSLSVQGDGYTTSSVRLLLTNKTKLPLKLVISANEVLHPNTASVQTMMITKDLVVTVPVGQVTIAEVPTVCASVKTVPPPPKDGVSFAVGPYADAKLWQQLSAIIAAAAELDRSGAFASVPINTGRIDQIAQLAVWRVLGLASGKPEHAVSPETIQADLLRAVADQVKKNPELLKQLGDGYELSPKGELLVTKRQKKALDERVASIFDAVDLTVRRSADPGLKNVASLPQDSTWDTYVNVGERSYQNGDYVEAEELLSQAVQEAESFGEADARLSRSMTSLGKCYLDLSWWEKAESLFNRALKLREKVAGLASPEVAEVSQYLGLLKQHQKLYGVAEELFKRALGIFEKSAGASSKAVAEVLNNLGKNFYLQDDNASAEPLFKRALAIMLLDQQQTQDKGFPTLPSSDVAEVETNLADAYCKSGKYEEANALFKKALAIDSKTLGEDHPYVATILDGLATVSTWLNQKDTAELYKKKAQEIREKALGKEHEQIAMLPLGTEALTRIKLYTAGSKAISSSLESVKAGAASIGGASSDKAKVNRPIKDKWALVIGISEFQDPSINLKFAAKDARDFANFLVKEGKFAPDHVRLLINKNATRESILAEIGDKWLPRVANPDDLVLIFVSSHGSPSKVDLNGVNYLVAYNTDKNSLYATGVPMQDMMRIIKERVHSDRVVLMMDACHSGAATPTKGLFRISNFSADELAQGTGQLVVCSSEPTQSSWESKRYDNGVFTHHLIDALRQNGGMARLGDVFKYLQDQVQNEVLRDRGELQTPLLKSKWTGDDLVISVTPIQPRPGLEEDSKVFGLEEKPVQSTAVKEVQPTKKAPPAKKVGSPSTQAKSAKTITPQKKPGK